MTQTLQNTLNLKPYQTRTMFADRFQTAADLLILIEKCKMVSGQDADQINIEFGREERIVSSGELEAECLSDGSIVYNLILKA